MKGRGEVGGNEQLMHEHCAGAFCRRATCACEPKRQAEGVREM